MCTWPSSPSRVRAARKRWTANDAQGQAMSPQSTTVPGRGGARGSVGIQRRYALIMAHRAARLLRRTAYRYYTWRGDLLVELTNPANWPRNFELYDAMRAHGHVYVSKASKIPVITTHEAVTAILKDPRFKAGPPNATNDPTQRIFNADLLVNMDPPRHTQSRKLLTKGFTLKSIEAMSPWITELCQELLDAVEGEREFDAVP